MNETLKNIRERYSCRSYTGTLPSDATIQAIAQAGNQAPSSMNRQRWQIIVVRDRALIDEIEDEMLKTMAKMPDQTMYERIMARGGHPLYNAPCMIFVPIQPDELASASLDCGIVCENISLAAQSLGLGSCICGLAALAFAGEKADYFKEKLAFPAGYQFGNSVLIGEVDNAGKPHVPDDAKIIYIG